MITSFTLFFYLYSVQGLMIPTSLTTISNFPDLQSCQAAGRQSTSFMKQIQPDKSSQYICIKVGPTDEK